MSFLIQLIIVVILIGLGAYFWKTWQDQKKCASVSANTQNTPSVSAADIEQVRAGGVIQLPPHGDDMAAKDVQVTARHVYEEDGFQWHELEGDAASGTVWLEVCHDDELETSVTLQRLDLDAIGLTVDAIQTLGTTDSNTLSWRGHQFEFAEHGSARFFRTGDRSQGENFEYWDFEGDDEKHDLGIEKWAGEYRVYLSQRLDPARIRIYSLGASS